MKITALAAALLLVGCADPGDSPGDGAALPLPWIGSWFVTSQACHMTTGAACHSNFAGGPGPDQGADVDRDSQAAGGYVVSWHYGNVVVSHTGAAVDGCLSMTDSLDAGLSAYSVCADGDDLVVASTWHEGTAQQCECATMLSR